MENSKRKRMVGSSQQVIFYDKKEWWPSLPGAPTNPMFHVWTPGNCLVGAGIGLGVWWLLHRCHGNLWFFLRFVIAFASIFGIIKTAWSICRKWKQSMVVVLDCEPPRCISFGPKLVDDIYEVTFTWNSLPASSGFLWNKGMLKTKNK